MAILELLNLWRELIIDVITENKLAAAIVSIIAIGVFFLLREKKTRAPAIDFTIVLLGWAVVVPIVGFVMTVVGTVWATIEATVPIVASLLGSFYRIYERHPVMVIMMVAVAVLAYFAWRRWWPTFLPAPSLKIVSLRLRPQPWCISPLLLPT